MDRHKQARKSPYLLAVGVGGDVGEGGQRGECGVAGMGGGVGSFEELVDHLGAAALLLALGVLLIIAHGDH